MTLPKVSVIVTTYNRAHMVTETIDSILSQTYRYFELIVVDDVSSDRTEDIVKSYTDERIRYFRHRSGRIIAVNRNYGISKAQGEYIAFCDDDDLWMPEKLERQLLEFEKDSRIGLVCTNGINFDRDGEYEEIIKTKLEDGDFTFESLIWRNFILNCSTLVRKQVIDDVGMLDESPEIFTAEDYELWLRIAKEYPVKYIGIPLVKYRTHPGASRYTRNYIERIERDKAVYRKLLNKEVLEFELYQRKVNKLDRRILILKFLTRMGIIEYVSFLARLVRRLRYQIKKKLRF